MTDRIHALTVLLDEPIRIDDLEAGLIVAISMLKGVAKVTPHVTNVDVYWAQETARLQLHNVIYKLLSGEGK